MNLIKELIPINNKIVWITLITPGYIKYAQNFFKTLYLNKIDFKVLVFCSSDECIDALKEFSSAVCIKIAPAADETNLMKWGEQAYKEICFQKLDVLSSVLNLISEDKKIDALGYIDTDTIMLKNISNIFFEHLNQYPDVDVFAQCDEGGEECSNHSNCLCLCAGVILFRNKLSLDILFKYKKEEMCFFNNNDQEFICKLLRHNKHIKHRTISKKIILNGLNKYVKRHSNDLPATACLLHFNYMVGETKITNMKKRGVWILD